MVVVDLVDRDCWRRREMLLLLFFVDAPTAYALRWRRLLRRMS